MSCAFRKTKQPTKKPKLSPLCHRTVVANLLSHCPSEQTASDPLSNVYERRLNWQIATPKYLMCAASLPVCDYNR